MFIWVFEPLRALFLGTAPESVLESEVRVVGAEVCALLITLQIRIFSFIWEQVARFINDRENHRTQQDKSQSLVYKLFFVKSFNLMYPYFYIAFMKEWIEGCRGGPCTTALQQSLFIMFVSNAGLDWVFAVFSWFLERRAIK